MIRLLVIALLLSALAVPAAADGLVYLKDGGVIQAASIWRSKGRVQVLVNRESLVEFNPDELYMKRTFPGHHRTARRKPAVKTLKTETAAPGEAAVTRNAKEKKGFLQQKLPSLPERSPSSPAGKEEGTLKKQKREMTERLNE